MQEDFSFDKWKNFDKLPKEAQEYFRTVEKGKATQEGLNQAMSKTMKVTTASGEAFVFSGNKLKDFGKKAKSSFSSFGKLAKTGLKSFGAGLVGTLANVGINFLIGTVLDKAISAWQNYSNVQENAIDKSKESLSALQENQNKIKSAQDVFNDIKSNTVIDSSGNEITRFEQLSRGVNSLGENVSLTASEFEEYNSILNSMSSAGLTATTSMAGLEAQVKEIRKSANIDSLKGLGDWIEGFNAQNNQMYTDSTKEVGLQQKLSALNKAYADVKDVNDKVQKIENLTLKERGENVDYAFFEDAVGKIDSSTKKGKELLALNQKATDAKALKELAKEYNLDILDAKGEIDQAKLNSEEVQTQLGDIRTSLESEVESMVRESSGFLQALFENSPEFDKISDSAANAIGSIFNNIDYDTIEKHMLDSNGNLSRKRMEDWVNNISTYAKNKGVQEKLSNLFSLGTDTGNKSFKEYEGEVNNLLDGITKSLPGISKSLLKDSSGVSDILKDASSAYERVKETVGEDFANKLSMDNLDLAAEIISTQDVKNAQELRDAMLIAKQAAVDINANPIFDSIEEAKKSKNGGSDYEASVGYLKEAKELYDKGLYGTDDFKSIAKYLSPTGAEDPTNFLENYGKAARYLTEDGSGVLNFLQDLSTKTDESGEALAKFDKQTGTWSYNIKDLEGAAEQMGMGFEFFMDMFGRLEDYGFSNNFFSSLEEGTDKLSEKVIQLAKQRKELAELESEGQYTTTDENGNTRKTKGNQTDIDQKKKEIQQTEQEISGLEESIDEWAENAATQAEAKAKSAKEQYEALKKVRDEYAKSDNPNKRKAAEYMDEQLKELAQEGLLEIDAEMNIINKDEVAKDIEDINKKAEEAQEKAKEAAESSGNTDLSKAMDFDISSLDTVDEIESKIKELTSEQAKLEVDSSEYQALGELIDSLNQKKETLTSSSPQVTLEGMQSAYTTAAELVNKINEINEINARGNVSIDVANEGEVKELAEELAALPPEVKVDLGLEPNASAEQIIQQIQNNPDSITVPVEYEEINENPLDKGTNEKEVTVNLTVNGEEQLDTLKTTIDGIKDKEVTVSAKLAGGMDSLLLQGGNTGALFGGEKNATINVTATVNDDEVDQFIAAEHKANGTVTWDNDTALVDSFKAATHTANGTVNWGNNTVNVETSFEATGTVTWTNANGPGHASGTVLSPARANGTAYNTLNMSPAHAGGNVSLPKDEKALVNELPKPESIVRDGVWRIIPGGAHIEQLKKGDIIFNGEQTEQLLKYGSILGHGKAYADGSIGNVRDLVRTPLSAYAGGFGGGVLGAGGSGSQANFGGSNSNKGNSNKATNTANQISKNTKKTADTVKDISNELSNYEDWVERRFKAIESEFAHLEAVFERITHLPDKLAKAYELLAKNKDYMNTVNDSKATYQSHLDKIKGQGLSQDIIDKIEMGSLEISSYSEETQKLISEYETYYNKLRDCTAQYDELLAKQSELVESTLDSVSDYYEMINNVDEASKAVFEAQRELYENLGISVTSKSQSDSLNKSIAEQEKITNRLTAQIEAYKAQIDTLVSSGYMEVNSKEYFAAHEALNQMNKELAESKSALIEFQDQLYELEYTGIQNIIDRFEQAVDKLDAKISYIKSKDEKVSENLYQEQINANNSQIREKMQLKAKKEKEQSLYEVGSTRYQELAEEINNLDKETYGLLTTNEELKDSIFELRFADLEEGIQGYQDLRNEIEDFKSLLNEEAFFDKGGSITEDGLANLALLQQQMASAKQEIADYRTGLDKLQESFDNGVISETEYNEKSAEYREGIRNSIKDIKDYEDSLTDLYMTQMSKENEALQKTIDQYAEARKRKASYFEYDKKLKGQQKSVDMLKAQIAALEGVNNATAAAEKKRLEAELKEEQESLDDIKREHKNEMMDLGDEKFKEDLDKILEDTEYEIIHNADKQQEVISNMLNNVVNMYANAYDKINSIIANTGFVGSSGFNSNQGQLGSQSGAVSQNNQATQHQSNVKPSGNASSTVTKPIENDNAYHGSLEQELDKKPNTDNRLVAELKLSTTSVTLEEGKSTKVTYSIRPGDAKNKALSWNTSNVFIASVSNGTIRAVSPGSCQVTVSTLDGSGISASITVTVTKKPDPPKPQKPQTPNNSGGDGKPNIGDAVIYKSGRYYYSSTGTSPAGNQMLGQTVYIGHINNASWAKKPYAIYRDRNFKQGLGWVSLDQLEGYKNGSKYIQKDGLAWTQEGSGGKSKPELIIRKSDGAMATMLQRGDAVAPNNLTENLFAWGAISPKKLLGDAVMSPMLPTISNRPELSVVNNYDSLIRVEGNVDRNVVADLKQYEKEFLNKSRDYTINYFNSELRKGGFRK